MDDISSTILPSRHLVIAGTGRAGTSFLVRYLTELGLDTSLSRRGDAAGWDGAANAGLEDLPIVTDWEDLPYVVKSPWIGEYIGQVLAQPRIALDAIVIPVRDLVEAATSRAVLETRALHQNTPWMAALDRTWEVWANTPGGIVYSLNPLDQARLLAVSFHNLVQRAVEAEIPLCFLAFPRMVEDGEYLYRALQPVLPRTVTAERARAAHAMATDIGKVRVGAELAAIGGSPPDAAPPHREAGFPTPDDVDRMALRRELGRLREELGTALARTDILHGELFAKAQGEAEAVRLRELAVAQADDLTRQLRAERARADAAEQFRDAVAETARMAMAPVGQGAEACEDLRDADVLTSLLRKHASETKRLDEAREAQALRAAELSRRLEEVTRERDEARRERDAILASGTWRVLAPYRRLRHRLGRG